MVEVNEPGTSKTCFCCGAWNALFRTARTFTYVNPKCQFEIARDENGAINNVQAQIQNICFTEKGLEMQKKKKTISSVDLHPGCKPGEEDPHACQVEGS